MGEERVWLRHKETGHFFECPVAAVADWVGLGWEPTDERPAEVNPVTAERQAWLTAQQTTNEPGDVPAESEE